MMWDEEVSEGAHMGTTTHRCVPNVSIIFDFSMLLYYLFWMLMGYILHFYIIFGTNLLTGGPAQIAVFPTLGFRRKGISNEVQME